LRKLPIVAFRCLLAMSLLCYSTPVFANDIYYAPTAQGSNNGTSCANAYAINDATHGLQNVLHWVADNVLHLCAFTFTGAQGATLVSSQASGTSGHPITIKCETGAVLSSPAWGGASQGAITITHDFITVDGGGGPGSCTIQNTLDGNAGNTNCLGGTCTVQQAVTYGIFSTGKNTIAKNLDVTHISMHTFQASDAGFFRGNSVAISIRGDNSTATENTLDNASVGVECANANACDISFNTMTAISRFVTIPISVGSQLANIKIHNNDFSAPWVWDSADNGYHHNGVHAFTSTGVPGAGVTNLQIYYNYMHGIWGEHDFAARGQPEAIAERLQSIKPGSTLTLIAVLIGTALRPSPRAFAQAGARLALLLNQLWP